MLVTVPDLLSTDEAAGVRARLEAAEWEDGRATAGHRAARVKANRQLPLDHPLARELGDMLLERLARNPLFVAAALPLRVLPPRFNRYEGGGHYGSHVDSAIFPVPGSATRVRTDLSATLFLSDPEAYEGGALVIEDSFGEQRVGLPAGQMLLYPGSALHRVEPVTRGVRYAAFFWTQSLVARDDRRRVLFELDGAIQAVSADHPDHAAIERLSNVYHNLLRQWSTT